MIHAMFNNSNVWNQFEGLMGLRWNKGFIRLRLLLWTYGLWLEEHLSMLPFHTYFSCCVLFVRKFDVLEIKRYMMISLCILQKSLDLYMRTENPCQGHSIR